MPSSFSPIYEHRVSYTEAGFAFFMLLCISHELRYFGTRCHYLLTILFFLVFVGGCGSSGLMVGSGLDKLALIGVCGASFGGLGWFPLGLGWGQVISVWGFWSFRPVPFILIEILSQLLQWLTPFVFLQSLEGLPSDRFMVQKKGIRYLLMNFIKLRVLF